MRDLSKDFRDYAANPVHGSEYVPIHRATLAAAADELDRLRAELAEARKLHRFLAAAIEEGADEPQTAAEWLAEFAQAERLTRAALVSPDAP